MYFKKVLRKISNKWYATSITSGVPITTDHIADRLAAVSTVSRTDVAAVLKELAGVMADYMALGQTVKLEGLGTFYYTANSQGNGKDTPEEVTGSDIKAVRVTFIPETTYNNSRQTTRSLTSSKITWEPFPGTETGTPVTPPSGGDNGGGGTDPNPLG